jgi:hypothetical protein
MASSGSIKHLNCDTSRRVVMRLTRLVNGVKLTIYSKTMDLNIYDPLKNCVDKSAWTPRTQGFHKGNPTSNWLLVVYIINITTPRTSVPQSNF